MRDAIQRQILERYDSGDHHGAFGMQLDFEEGRLRRNREQALRRLHSAARKPLPLFACGIYQPVRSGLHASAEPVAELACTYSEAILRLKELRPADSSRPDAYGARALVAFFAERLAQRLRRLWSRGDLGASSPVTVCQVPPSKAGPLSHGLALVLERACVLAGAEFLNRPLILRGSSVAKAHQGELRTPETQIESLMPLRDTGLKGRVVVLVDDVVSSGNTLRCAGELLGLYNEAIGRGIALAKTAAVQRDLSGAEVI